MYNMSWRIIYKSINQLAKETIIQQQECQTFLDAWLFVPTEPPWIVITRHTADNLFHAVNRAVVAHKGNEMVVIERILPKATAV